MTRSRTAFVPKNASVPRPRGDDPADQRDHRNAQNVFPAHAGMTRLLCRCPRSDESVPRPRGDDPDSYNLGLMTWSVFPAHAGMTRLGAPPSMRTAGAPKLGGI